MERNYFEKVHQNNIKWKRKIHTTLVEHKIFDFQNYIKICVATSVFHLSCSEIYRRKTLIFFSSKSGRKKYIETNFAHRSYIEQSTSKQHQYFTHGNYIRKVCRNDVEIIDSFFSTHRCNIGIILVSVQTKCVRYLVFLTKD